MESLLLISIFIMVTLSIYLLLQKRLLKIIVGLNILSQAINLIIFTAGYNNHNEPPFISELSTQITTSVSDPLPQALILTAIVISFAMIAFFVVLVKKTLMNLQTDHIDQMRDSDYDAINFINTFIFCCFINNFSQKKY